MLRTAAQDGCKEAKASLSAIETNRALILHAEEAAKLVKSLASQDRPVKSNPQAQTPPREVTKKKKKRHSRLKQDTFIQVPGRQRKPIQSLPDIKEQEPQWGCPFCTASIPVSEFPGHLASTHNVQSGTRSSTPIVKMYPNLKMCNCPVCIAFLPPMQMKQHLQKVHPECLGASGYIHFVQGGLAGL